jgi:ketosteroid isomerase-like protein
MSQENVELVRRAYAEFKGGRFNVDFLDPEIEWRGPREFPDLAEPHFGHEGVGRYLDKVYEAFDDYRMVPEEFIDAGDDQVLVFSRAGELFRDLYGSFAYIDTDYSDVRDYAEALEAAGLVE